MPRNNKIKHSQDGLTVIVAGNKADPEPTLHTIQFPGGYVEVSRCSDGSYYAHIGVEDTATISDSRVDYPYDLYISRAEEGKESIPTIEDAKRIKKVAVRIHAA
ncbi:hypothetical protein AB6D11_18720 [Vibrio splendidus]